MNYILTTLFVVSFSLAAFAGDDLKNDRRDAWAFEDIILLPVSPVEDQHRSGTCWSFAGLSFIQSEMMRLGKPGCKFFGNVCCMAHLCRKSPKTCAAARQSEFFSRWRLSRCNQYDCKIWNCSRVGLRRFKLRGRQTCARRNGPGVEANM
jgi:hypothetical protein